MNPNQHLLSTFLEIHPADAARAFEALQHSDAVGIFRKLPSSVADSLLENLNPQFASRLLGETESSRSAELIEAISPRKASMIVHYLEEGIRTQVLDRLPKAKATLLQKLAEYPSDSAGSMMEPRVASIPLDITAQRAIALIRKTPPQDLHYLYVTTRDGKLAGVLNMRDLLLASPRDPIEEFVRRNIVSVSDTMIREEVVNAMQERGFLALPVVDFDGHLIGVIKHSDVLDVAQQEGFEDLQKLVGAGADERALSPVSLVVKSRLPWLYVNLGTAFLASAVVGLFEGVIAKVAALAVLLPVVAGQGGNTGSQSLAVVMRGIALREIIPGKKKRVIGKELLGGVINGLLVALVTSVAVFAWRAAVGDSMTASSALALVIGLAMVVNMAAAALSGAVIPLVLKSLGRDPAQSASIFLTTVTDIVGFSAFLGFAALFLPMLT